MLHWWILIALGVLMSGYLLIRWLDKPLVHRVEEIDGVLPFLSDLLKFAGNGTVLRITERNSGSFVQFVRQSREDEIPVVHFSYPDAEWSRGHFENVRNAFDHLRIPYCVIPTGKSRVRRFLDVENLTEPNRALEVAHAAFDAMSAPAGPFDVVLDGYWDWNRVLARRDTSDT